MIKIKSSIVACLLLFPGFVNAQDEEINLFSFGPPKGTDTLFYPFYDDVQMIEIDNVGAWEADVSWHEGSQPRALSWSMLIPGPFPNVYIFRNKEGTIVKAFNTTTSLEQLTKDFNRIPINKKSSGFHSLTGNTHAGRYHSGWGDYHSRMLDFRGRYLVYEKLEAFLDYDSNVKAQGMSGSGKVGLIDSFGNYFLPIEYTHLEPLNNNIIVCKDSMCGIIDGDRHVVLPANYERYDYLSGGDELAFYQSNQVRVIYHVKTNTYKQIAGFDWIGEDWLFQYRYNPRPEYPPLIPVRNGFLTGLVDTGFNVVTPLIYDWCIPAFYTSMTVACRNGKFGYLDKKGKEVIPCIYTYAEYFINGVGVVQYNGEFRNIDSTGKLLDVTTRNHEQWRNAHRSDYSIGELKVVQTMTGYGLMDSNDVFVVPGIYENIIPMRASINGKEQFSDKTFIARRFGKLGIVDTAGNVLLPFEYELISDYPTKYEFRTVKKDDKHWAVINRNYELVLPAFYEGISPGYDTDYFSFWENGKVGTMDTTGKVQIPAIYTTIFNFENGRALAIKDSMYGFIDRKGNILIPFQYEQVYGTFTNGLAGFMQKGLWGFIDTTGAIVLPAVYEEVRRFQSEITGVKMNGKWGFINRKGKLVVDYHYEFVAHEWSYDKLCEVRRGGKLGFVNSKGEEVIPCIYDNSWGYSPGQGHFLEKDGQRRYVKPE